MMAKRINHSSGAIWEDKVGYSRAVQVGDYLELSGTVSMDEYGVVGKGDYYRQTAYILEKIEQVLQKANFGLADVVRTRIFVCDITQWEAVGQCHNAFFRSVKPATSMIEVSALIHPDCLVEIEVTAQKADKYTP